MANCAYCGTSILFGGVSDGPRRYCNNDCHVAGYFVSLASQIPPAKLDEMVHATRVGQCPKCGKAGSPVDVYMAHRIWSALILTSWSSQPEVSCKSCATKRQLRAIAFSGTLGWWGFPWGLIGTPVQIIRNFSAMAAKPKRDSPLLRKHVQVVLGQRLAEDLAMAESQQVQPAVPPPLP
ncbi:hypothetical protein [Roseibacillus persicicus]|uniref:hypothetical protein n=1 Tax=Roseibacillus persicicus TaxID=454148 RepID=UPI00280C8163|nr:hypothetical protein [Roseibacillus persicicus]MDQ8190505.1 hypothetical protein [Roseibacillus persicicus]